jgi:hypothetical protein
MRMTNSNSQINLPLNFNHKTGEELRQTRTFIERSPPKKKHKNHKKDFVSSLYTDSPSN